MFVCVCVCGVCLCVYSFVTHTNVIGASLSEPHIDHDNVPRHGECLYLSMYLSGRPAACSVCRLNVPKNTPIQSITRCARAHWQRPLRRHWTCWTRSFKNRLQKLGQLLAQGFCCVDSSAATIYRYVDISR